MKLQTVTGRVDVEAIRLADGHGHVWIDPPPGVPPEARLELNNYAAIASELTDFHAAGGMLIVDCQPGGCGRDTGRLRRLSEVTGVYITATTGFHQRRYYPDSSELWTAGAEEAAEAARQTGAAVLFHTEHGINVEALLPFFSDRGAPANWLYLCHMDKRLDFGLHRELALAGALLGYDTFVRPKYNPDAGVWPLLRHMLADGPADHAAICLDLALPSLWRYGGGVGLLTLTEQIIPGLRAEGIDDATITRLTGRNVAQYLVRQSPDSGALIP